MVCWSGLSIFPPSTPEQERADQVADHTMSNSELPLSMRSPALGREVHPYGVIE